MRQYYITLQHTTVHTVVVHQSPTQLFYSLFHFYKCQTTFSKGSIININLHITCIVTWYWPGNFTTKKERIKNTEQTKPRVNSLDNNHMLLCFLPSLNHCPPSVTKCFIKFSSPIHTLTNHDRMQKTCYLLIQYWVYENVSSLAGICEPSVSKTYFANSTNVSLRSSLPFTMQMIRKQASIFIMGLAGKTTFLQTTPVYHHPLG